MKSYLIFLFVILSAFSSHASYKILESDHFQVYYHDGFAFEAYQALISLETFRTNAERLTGFKTQKKIPIIIEDSGLFVNGMADPINEKTYLYAHQPRANFGMLQNWWVDVSFHEYIHILHMTGAIGFPYYFRKIFGAIYSPNLISPPWVFEGITVYSESRLSPYSGRLNDGYYHALLLARAKEKKFPSLPTASYSPVEVPTDAIYAYGGEFHRYLESKYGKEKIPAFYRKTGSDYDSAWNILFPFMGFDSDMSYVFGKRTPSIWKDWEKDMEQKAESAQWDGIRLTKDSWIKEDLVSDDRSLYYRQRTVLKTGPFTTKTMNSIMRLDPETGEKTVLLRLMTASMLDMKVKNGKLYYSTMEIRSGFKNKTMGNLGAIATLHTLDLKTGKKKRLLSGELTGYGIFDDGKILYSKSTKGSLGAEVFLFNPETGNQEKLYSVPFYPESFFIEKETVIVNAKYEGKNYSIYSMNMETGELTPVIDTPWHEYANNLKNGRIYYTANFNSTYSCYLHNLQTGQDSRLTQSFYGTTPNEMKGEVYYLGLHSYGHEIYKATSSIMQVTLPDEKEIPLKSPGFQIDIKARNSCTPNLISLWPKYIIPAIEFFDDDSMLLGISIAGGDNLDRFMYQASYFPEYQATTISGQFLFPRNINLMVDYSTLWPPAQTGAYLDIPFWTRTGSGLTSVSASAGGYHYDIINLFEVSLSAQCKFSFPLTKIILGFDKGNLILDHRNYPKITYLTLQYEQLLGKTILNSKILGGIYEDWILYHTYNDTFFLESDSKGDLIFASLSLKRKLISINWGSWNPNILYLEDLFISLFGDTSGTSAKIEEWKLGGRLELEHKLSFALQLKHEISYFYTGSGGWKYSYTLNNSIMF